MDNMTEEDVIRGYRSWRAKRGDVTTPKWYDIKLGNPTFRRYFWAIMLALSIANAMREFNQLWRALQDAESSR
jgi:hypothetical protein